MAYSKEEQETFIHYDVQTKQTRISSNYGPDIAYYLKLADEKGITITSTEVENDRVIHLEGILNTEKHSLSRRPKRRRQVSDEQREAARQRFALARAQKKS